MRSSAVDTTANARFTRLTCTRCHLYQKTRAKHLNWLRDSGKVFAAGPLIPSDGEVGGSIKGQYQSATSA